MGRIGSFATQATRYCSPLCTMPYIGSGPAFLPRERKKIERASAQRGLLGTPFPLGAWLKRYQGIRPNCVHCLHSGVLHLYCSTRTSEVTSCVITNSFLYPLTERGVRCCLGQAGTYCDGELCRSMRKVCLVLFALARLDFVDPCLCGRHSVC